MSYTLQDAKDEFAVRQRFKDWDDYVMYMHATKVTNKKRELAHDAAAELYKEKATEELRKQLEDQEIVKKLMADGHNQIVEGLMEDQARIKSGLNAEIERLAQSNKDKEEEINSLREFNNTQDERWREYSKKLEDSNKELVDAAKLIISKLVTYHRDNTSPSKDGYNVMVSILDRVIEKSKP
jgi:hypothetical protein